MILVLEETFLVGNESFFDSISFNGQFGVVFEDNTETGYFYAVDATSDQRILDALHIYNVDKVVDGNKPSQIQITWDEGGNIASLLINSYCHAVFDFPNQSGYCRNGFPEANHSWSKNSNRTLTDELINQIFEA